MREGEEGPYTVRYPRWLDVAGDGVEIRKGDLLESYEFDSSKQPLIPTKEARDMRFSTQAWIVQSEPLHLVGVAETQQRLG